MSKKILILDDDDDILNIMSFILVDDGYEVKALSSGEKIFEEINQFLPDMVVMDVMLAKMDEREICRELKATDKTKSIPVILVSGTHNLAGSLQQQGAPNDFVTKPFDINYLLAKVHSLI